MESKDKDSARNKSRITEFLGGPENFEKYENCKRNEDRIAIVYHSPLVQYWFKTQNEIFKKSDETAKNDKESKRLRELGNNAFKQKRDLKALELYTEAIVYADQVKDFT